MPGRVGEEGRVEQVAKSRFLWLVSERRKMEIRKAREEQKLQEKVIEKRSKVLQEGGQEME